MKKKNCIRIKSSLIFCLRNSLKLIVSSQYSKMWINVHEKFLLKSFFEQTLNSIEADSIDRL